MSLSPADWRGTQQRRKTKPGCAHKKLMVLNVWEKFVNDKDQLNWEKKSP